MALRRRRSADEYESTLHVIAAEVASLRQTIETLLFLARSSDEATPPDRQRIDLPGWLDSYWAHWKTDARWPDIRSHAEAGLTCDASPSLLAQLLDILISNALKYSQSGSLVEVRAAKLDNRLQLEVVDRGIGIAPDDLEAIFDPFFRTRQARHSGEPGTGLGLAIARRLAKALGSELRCESQLGAGSRFWLTLPHADCDNRLPAEIVRTK